MRVKVIAGERAGRAIWLDCRAAWRSLRVSPGFTATAVVLLAFGISLNTAAFSVINAILFRSLGVPAPQQLVFLSRPDAGGNQRKLGALEDVGANHPPLRWRHLERAPPESPPGSNRTWSAANEPALARRP